MPRDNDTLLEQLRTACAAYHRASAVAQLDLPPGVQREARLAEIMATAADSASVEAIEALKSLRATVPEASQTALQQLLAWALTMHMQGAMVVPLQDLRERQRQAVCQVDGEPIPLLASFMAMASESRRDRRGAIEAAVGNKLLELNDSFATQFATLCRTAETLGYPSPDALWADIAPVPPAEQREMATQLLADTHEVYVDLLAWAVKQRLDIPVGRLRRHDILALFTFRDYQRYYQPSTVVPALQACLRDMDIDPLAAGRLAWRERAAAFSVPEALAVHIPEEVVLGYATVGGVKGAEAFASACGRALTWSYTSADLPEISRLTSDAAVVDSSAQLLTEALCHPRWLHHYLRVSVDSNYVAWRRLDRLYRLRRQLGRFLYTQHLYSNASLADAQESYRDLMMEACLVDHPPEYCFLDWDWQYTSLTLWRSWNLSYSLREVLCQHIAEDWFRAPESGTWLRTYWQDALQIPAEKHQEHLVGTSTDSTIFLEALVGERW